MWHPVKRFSANTAGRDFVIGDVHGAYDSVLNAMAKASFDPKVDRLFSVGDLIDRGPGSARVRKFLAQPYVHAIRGNHEDMLLEMYADGEPDPAVVEFMVSRNGLGWWLSVAADEQKAILAAISELPLAIELDTPRGTVGLIHADVPAGMDWATFLQHLEAGDNDVIQTALWGRTRIQHDCRDGVVGIGRLFVGHTPQFNGLKQLANVYAIDTGAVFFELSEKPGARLSMANVMACTQVLACPPQAAGTDVRDKLPAMPKPFGDYATPASH